MSLSRKVGIAASGIVCIPAIMVGCMVVAAVQIALEAALVAFVQVRR